jgi:hypothetical protein
MRVYFIAHTHFSIGADNGMRANLTVITYPRMFFDNGKFIHHPDLYLYRQ